MKRNHYYYNKFIHTELKKQINDNELIKDIHIQKQNVIDRALIRANELINNRIKKGKTISDEEKNEIKKQYEIDFLKIFDLFENKIVKD